MKAIVIGALMAGLATGAAFAQEVQPPKRAPLVCLRTTQIDHTKTVDAQTLLFYMKDRKIWKNTLQSRCPSLKFYGFVNVTSDGKICSNQQIIYVLKTHETCVLGDFVPYTPPPKDKAGKPDDGQNGHDRDGNGKHGH